MISDLGAIVLMIVAVGRGAAGGYKNQVSHPVPGMFEGRCYHFPRDF